MHHFADRATVGSVGSIDSAPGPALLAGAAGGVSHPSTRLKAHAGACALWRFGRLDDLGGRILCVAHGDAACVDGPVPDASGGLTMCG